MSDFGKQKILVTGGAGYVGSHCCKVLGAQGHELLVVDNLERGHRSAVKWGELAEGDLKDKLWIEKTVSQFGPDIVFHFAAYAAVGESVQKPEMYFENNVVGSTNLLGAMEKQGCNKLVFSSTCATYGLPSSVPISERETQEPVNPYGETKLQVENTLRRLAEEKKLNSVALRYFNAAGSDPDTEIGEDHDPETHLIPLILEVARGKRNHISIFGQDYDTPDGTCIRDYVHVTDIAQAHLLAMKHLSKHQGFFAYNLGSSQGNSVKEVIQAVEQVTGKQIPVQEAPRREGDPPKLVAEPALVEKELGWKPQYSLNDQIAHAWAWMKQKQS